MIVFRVDGNKVIGMGHLMRCMSIADELKKRKIEVAFVIAHDTNTDVFSGKKYIVHRLKKNKDDRNNSLETVKWMEKNKYETIFVDSYNVDKNDFDILSRLPRVIYLDDLYSFDYRCDILINYNIEADEEHYINIVSPKKKYLGLKYFPLRNEFCNLSNKAIKKKVERVLVTTGSTDPLGIVYLILRELAVEYTAITFIGLNGKYFDKQNKKSLKDLEELGSKYG